MSTNPLLEHTELTPFDQIQPNHVAPAIEQLLKEAQQALTRVKAPGFVPSWANLAAGLDCALERLERVWGAVGHLQGVADNAELRAAYNQMLGPVSEFYVALGADEGLYALYKALDPATLNPEQSQARHKTLRDFVLSGAELRGAAKQSFVKADEQRASLSQKFSENLLDATDAWHTLVSAEALDGVPPDVVQAAREAAAAHGQEGYRLSLKAPCYLPVMQYARNQALRELLYRAYTTRASDQAEPALRQYDNDAVMQQTLQLRQQQAQLLGFADYAEWSLANKMAHDPGQVAEFLRLLAAKARPYAEQDVADMRAFAAAHLSLPDPKPWDWSYIAEQLRQARYAFSEQELKCYFALPAVLKGLFGLVQTLFELEIRPDHASLWHSDVTFYRIERQGQLIGQFYLDLFARTAKRGGAWMDGARTRWLRPGGVLQTPVAYLVCNFAPGVGGKPALLTHDDLTTLFHEFGHGLHHLLTQVNEREIAGISGVEWDAVELPSQFMENFCWEWEVLRGMSGHVDTGAPLPRDLFDKMLAAKNFQSGLQTLRQVEYALFDLLLHREVQPPADVMDLLRQVRAEVAVIHAPEWARMPHSFGHIFAGGYAAGYYSYKWAEVLSADVYAAFEETATNEQGFSLAIARKYRQTILETGASRPAIESFKAFRGREPQLDALLRHQGMS